MPAAHCEEEEAEEGEGEGDGRDDTCKKSIYNLIMGFVTSTLNCLGGKLQLNSPFELSTRFYVSLKLLKRVFQI